MLIQPGGYCGFCNRDVPWFCGLNILRCQQERTQQAAKADPDGNTRPWVYAFWSIALAGIVLLLLAVVWR